MPMPVWAPMVTDQEPRRAMASATSSAVVTSEPSPPKRSGISIINRPSSPAFPSRSRSSAGFFCSMASALGRTSPSTKSVAVRKNIRCSSVSFSGVNTGSVATSVRRKAPPRGGRGSAGLGAVDSVRASGWAVMVGSVGGSSGWDAAGPATLAEPPNEYSFRPSIDQPTRPSTRPRGPPPPGASCPT